MSDKMLGVHFLGSGKISIDAIERPKAVGKNVVIRVKASGICGTDRHSLIEHGQETIPGHEIAGEVVEVDNPSRVKVGDRVAINCHITCRACVHCSNGDLYFCDELESPGFEWNGGFAEYLLIPKDNCMPIPQDISFEIGALLVDVLGTAYRGVKMAKLIPGDKVAIWGAGPVGYEAAAVAAYFGGRIAILHTNQYRLDMVRDNLNPELVLNPTDSDTEAQIMDWTEDRGLEVGFECAGSEKAAQQALRVIKKRGKLAIIGVSHNLTVDPWKMIEHELTIYASRNFNLKEYDEMIGLIRNGLMAENVITHRFSLKDANKAFEEFVAAECGKIIFKN